MAKRLYSVQRGESLSSIARDRLGELDRWREIAYINSIDYPYVIRPGQIIALPNDGEPLEIVITGGVSPAGATAVNQAGSIEPATILVGLAVVAAVLLWGQK